MLSLWNPLIPEKTDRKMSSKNYLERLLTDPFETMFSDVFHAPVGMEYKKNEDGSLAIGVDVPGVKEEDINVEISADNILTVRGERKTATSSYSVTKAFSIPEGYSSEDIKAELKDGVLTLTLAGKPVQKEVKKIAITSSK